MSIRSRLVRFLLQVSGLKHKFGTREGIRAYVAHKRPQREAAPSRKMKLTLDICQYELAGFPVYHVQPRESRPRRHVVYLHGGAYINPIVAPHWSFIDRLIKASPCQVTVPLYGLAPEHNYSEGFELIHRIYGNLLEHHEPEDIVLMGDSSGGGMALAFAQSLLQKRLPQPGGVVMLSPWLDITMSNPQAVEVAKRDPMLDIPAAREAGLMWAAGAEPRLPLLSPIHGPASPLAPLCLLIGTDDMLLPDARLLRDRARAQNQLMYYSEHQGMFHTWMLLPMPESKTAVHEVSEFLKNPAHASVGHSLSKSLH